MSDVHNALHRFGSLIAGVRRMVGGGQDVAVERLGETLTPILNPWGLPEWAFLRGELLWAKRVVGAAVAAENTGSAIVNPAGSNRIVVIDAVTAWNATAGGSVVLAPTTEGVVTATYGNANVNVRDIRAARTLNLAVPQFWFGSNVGSILTAANIIDQINSPTTALGVFVCGLPFVLTPGFALVAEGAAVNQSVGTNWSGRVRAALPGELLG